MKINKTKITNILWIMLAWLLPLIYNALVYNAYMCYLADTSIRTALAYFVQLVLLVPLICFSFIYALKKSYKYIKSVYKKRIKKTDEMNKVLQLKTYFDIDFFDKYLKVYDENNNFVGYLVEKKK